MPPVQDFKSLLLSPQFTFLIGPPDHTEFNVPACVISSLSPSLDALMNNGSMQESVDRIVVFENLTPNMFAAVCEYAYTGSYRVPPSADDESEMPEDDCVMPAEILNSQGLGIKQEDLQREVKQYFEEVSTDWSFKPASKAPKKAKFFQEVSVGANTTRRLRQSFVSLQYNVQPHEEPQSRDLMFHARLYAFAEEQLIEALQTRCLAYIHRELQDLAAKEDVCEEFVQLLWFAYTSINRHGQSGEDRLRRLVIHYAACNLETLVQQSNFMALLDHHAECGSDLIRRLYT